MLSDLEPDGSGTAGSLKLRAMATLAPARYRPEPAAPGSSVRARLRSAKARSSRFAEAISTITRESAGIVTPATVTSATVCRERFWAGPSNRSTSSTKLVIFSGCLARWS